MASRRRIGISRRARDRIAERVSETAREHLAQNTRPHSKTLASTYEIAIRNNAKTVLITSPFFWAAILNEGHGPSVAQRPKILVWFRDPLRDDPRLQGGDHKTSRRALTKAEFARWSRINRQFKNPRDRPMILARGTRGTNPTNFLTKRLSTLRLKIIAIIEEEMTREIDSTVFDLGLDAGIIVQHTTL